MAKMSWTESQRQAFGVGRGDYLICAAAGSGKTTVLSERVIRSLTDTEHPMDITEMLIVTFTKASAADLKAKISKAITAEIGRRQGDSRLERQLLCLDRAKISTIDSFCLQIVSEHFTELGLPASPRIGGDAEVLLLQNQVMERMLDRLYEEQPPDFAELVRNFTSLSDRNFGRMLLKIYDTVRNYPEGIDFVKASADRMRQVRDEGIRAGVYGDQLRKTVFRMLRHHREWLSRLYRRLDPEVNPKKSIEVLESDLDAIDHLLAAGENEEWISAFADLKFRSLVRNSSKTDEYIAATEVRDRVKERIKNVQKSLISGTPDDRRIAADRLSMLLDTLYDLLRRFDSDYRAEKLRLGMLDFADVERYAYRLLVEDGKPTPAAKEIAGRFQQIYIDEYQDSNCLQDEIFKAISDKNRFMVGDIKQSIYGFRGAVPDLFAGYRGAFPDYSPDSRSESGRIFLSHNFRSRAPILRFVNLVFDRLFTNSSGRVPYVPEDDRLCLPDSGDPDLGLPVTLTLVPKDSDRSVDREAVYVASQIEKQIAAGRSPSDIAILIRSAATSAKPIERELQKRGIPTVQAAQENFFETPEVLLVLALLGAIDNPRRDVYLAGAMKSPLFGITLDDLIALRQDDRKRSLYDTLVSAVKVGSFAKGRFFLEWLEEFRGYAEKNPVDQVIRRLYRTTSLEALVGSASGSGSVGVDRLRRLYGFAHAFEGGRFRGVHRFLRYLEQAKESGKNPEVEGGAPSGDAVRIMTVHKSKGLEFPVVYLCRLAKEINTEDLKKSLQLDREMGISFYLREPNGYRDYDPLTRTAIVCRKQEELVDEELRVLYVALTRAKEELYLTAEVGDPSGYVADCRSEEPFDFQLLLGRGSYLGWLLAATAGTGFEPKILSEEEVSELVRADRSARVESSPRTDAGAGCTLDSETLRRRLDYVYPHAAETGLPTKAVVSRLFPTYLDDDPEPQYHSYHRKPEFLRENPAPTGAERGTATHLFMQFCDFERVRRDGIAAELARLVDRGYLTAETAGLVKLDKLPSFFRSSLFERMSESPELYREYRFLISRPAVRFTENPELAEKVADASILVQGVIDCFFLLPDGSWQLVDYKTDRMKTDDPERAAAELVDEYRNQLSYYRDAIESLTGRTVRRVSVFAFELGKEIELELEK